MQSAEIFIEVRTVRSGRIEVVPRDYMSRLLFLKKAGLF